MKEFSIDNGVHFVDFENITEEQKEFIEDNWTTIIMLMDDEDREETNNLTSVYTDTTEEKIEYIWDYLQIAKNDLIIG